MRDHLIEEFRRAVLGRDAARARRAETKAQWIELKGEIRTLDELVRKHEATVEAIQHEMLTGETGLDLVDAARRNGHADPPGDDDRPGERGPVDFHGRRQPKAKAGRERADEHRTADETPGFTAFDVMTAAGADALSRHLESIEREAPPAAPAIAESPGPFAVAADRAEIERQKRRDRDRRRKERLAGDASATSPASDGLGAGQPPPTLSDADKIKIAVKDSMLRSPERMSCIMDLGDTPSDEAIERAVSLAWMRGQEKLTAKSESGETVEYITRGGSTPALFLGHAPTNRRSPAVAGTKLCILSVRNAFELWGDDPHVRKHGSSTSPLQHPGKGMFLPLTTDH
ncbi:MAG: hypothetical protein ACYDCI_00305 [Candidatus Limnocylindrales bacterium]